MRMDSETLSSCDDKNGADEILTLITVSCRAAISALLIGLLAKP